MTLNDIKAPSEKISEEIKAVSNRENVFVRVDIQPEERDDTIKCTQSDLIQVSNKNFKGESNLQGSAKYEWMSAIRLFRWLFGITTVYSLVSSQMLHLSGPVIITLMNVITICLVVLYLFHSLM